MSESEPKIYLLPNLMTAGNLFCGFAAILRIFEGMLAGGQTVLHYYEAIWFILGACLFDLLDGRVARIAGTESPFGREFDSIADVVSFGVAPALLVFDILLAGLKSEFAYFVAFVYLLCGAMRLARFNCITSTSGDRDFRGFPIPAAAGLISSITVFLLHYFEGGEGIGALSHVLWVLVLLVSLMMFSKIRYPSFKGLNWKTRRSIPWVFAAVMIIVLTIRFRYFMPALIFVSYLLYGFARPWISKRWRREIEIEADTEPETGDGNSTGADEAIRDRMA